MQSSKGSVSSPSAPTGRRIIPGRDMRYLEAISGKTLECVHCQCAGLFGRVKKELDRLEHSCLLSIAAVMSDCEQGGYSTADFKKNHHPWLS